jgi:hypothetical protein
MSWLFHASSHSFVKRIAKSNSIERMYRTVWTS